jgi:nucleotide-binding universal stress UspA family protein
MIAMASQTGPVLSVLVGSTTRRVVREAGVPVLALR